MHTIFTAMQTMNNSYLWSGIIWSVVMGLALGNYACSLVHRLPRGRLLLDKAPYCGNCGTLLQVRDLFPVVSAMLLRHRCRYCGVSFPISHTVTELLLAGFFVLTFLKYDFGDRTILLVALSSFLIIISAIEVNEKLIMGKVMICVMVAGALLRTYLDHDLFDFVLGGLYGVIAGAFIWHKEITREEHIYRLPKQAELMAIAGICVGAKLFITMFLAFLVAYAFLWQLSKLFKKQFNVTIAFSAAILFTVFFYS